MRRLWNAGVLRQHQVSTRRTYSASPLLQSKKLRSNSAIPSDRAEAREGAAATTNMKKRLVSAPHDAAKSQDAADGVSASASPRWMHETLHYDTSRVEQLAKLFTGQRKGGAPGLPNPRDGSATTPAAAAAATAQAGTPVSYRNVETTLRQSDRPRQPVPASEDSTPPRGRPVSDGGSRRSRYAPGVDLADTAWTVEWASLLLTSPTPALQTCAQELAAAERRLCRHAGASPSPSPTAAAAAAAAGGTSSSAGAQGSLDDVSLLSSLLSVSRVQCSILRGPTLPLGPAAANTPSQRVLAVCLLAFALEAGCRSFQKAGEREAPSEPENVNLCVLDRDGRQGATPPNDPWQRIRESEKILAEWRREHIAAYASLLTQTIQLLTAELRELRHSPTAAVLEVDLLVMSLLSLTVCADVCATQTSKRTAPTHSTGAVSRQGMTVGLEAAVQHHAGLLQDLCETIVATLAVFCRTNTAAPSAAEWNLWRSYVMSVGSLRYQLDKVEKRCRALPHCRSGRCSLQGVRCSLFMLSILLLQRTTALEASAMHSARQPSRTEAQVLRDKEKVMLASHAEALYATIGPMVKLSHAAQSSLQYRTTSTSLSLHLHALRQYVRTVSQTRYHRSRQEKGAAETITAAASKPRQDYSSPQESGLPPFSSATLFLEERPATLAAIVGSYTEMLAAVISINGTPAIATDISSSSSSRRTACLAVDSFAASDLCWLVPFYSRVLRVGLSMQLDMTVLAAAHLGMEARTPPSPETPLAKVMESRRATHQRRTRAASDAQAAGGRPWSAGDRATTPREAVDEGGDSTSDAQWRRVYRLSGVLRVVASESLYRTFVALAAFAVHADTPASSLLATQTRSNTEKMKSNHIDHSDGDASHSGGNHPEYNATSSSVSFATSPAGELVKAMSRIVFTVPRTEYLLGFYTDDTSTTPAAMEQARRVLTACAGVLLWLRELAPPAGQQHLVTNNTPVAAKGSAEARWQVCGTTKANALEGAFFLTYLLHHWPMSTEREGQSSMPRSAQPWSLPFAASVVSAQDSDLPPARVSDSDRSLAAFPAVPADPLLSSAAVESYVAETLFHLQHDTASLLRHLRTTDRFYHFTGEVRDKSRLMEEAALRRRHVSSTLSIVQAFQQQPSFVWMPLQTVQEIIFELRCYPFLLRSSTAEMQPSSRVPQRGREGGQLDTEHEQEGGGGGEGSGVREYPAVEVGSVVCTFARAHGYLVRRLHVLSGVLREYRSLLLQSNEFSGASAAVGEGAGGGDAGDEAGNADTTTTTVRLANVAVSSGFVKRLVANAARSPQEANHRKNNHAWAHPWATMLREEFPSLPSEMEGTGTAAAGVLRTLERMEQVMLDTTRQGLFVNVVKSQQQYKALRREQRAQQAYAAEHDASGGVSSTGHSDAQGVFPHDLSPMQPQEKGKSGLVIELQVIRASPRVPLGVALNGSGRVLRVQHRVPVPRNAADDREDDDGEETGEDVPSPFAAALTASGHVDGAQWPRDVVGARVVAVDGVSVSGGREVAAQVQGKTRFQLSLEL